MSINIPSGDPANLDSLSGAFREVFGKFLQNVDTMLPAQVLEYFPGTPSKVRVQPLIMLATTGGDFVTRAAVGNIPVFQLGGGNFIINFPLNVGDLGWIIANDRDISIFEQSFKNSTTGGSLRVKNFSDAIFLPDKMTGYSIAEEDANNFVIQNLNGTVKISVSNDTINVVAPTVNVNASSRVNLGGLSGAAVARVGDSVVDGVITSGSTKVFST